MTKTSRPEPVTIGVQPPLCRMEDRIRFMSDGNGTGVFVNMARPGRPFRWELFSMPSEWKAAGRRFASVLDARDVVAGLRYLSESGPDLSGTSKDRYIYRPGTDIAG